MPYIATLYKNNPNDKFDEFDEWDHFVDETSIDENDTELAKELFLEFGHGNLILSGKYTIEIEENFEDED